MKINSCDVCLYFLQRCYCIRLDFLRADVGGLGLKSRGPPIVRHCSRPFRLLNVGKEGSKGEVKGEAKSEVKGWWEIPGDYGWPAKPYLAVGTMKLGDVETWCGVPWYVSLQLPYCL